MVLYIFIYIHHSFFIHSLIDGYLSSFHVLIIENNASMNTRLQIFFLGNVFTSFGYIPRGRITGSYGSTFVNKGPCSQGYGFTSSHAWMWELDYKESWAPKNWCLKEISPEYSLEELSWRWNSNVLATWCEKLIHWKILRCGARLKARGEGDHNGWDGLMASLTQWTWVWASSGR